MSYILYFFSEKKNTNTLRYQDGSMTNYKLVISYRGDNCKHAMRLCGDGDVIINNWEEFLVVGEKKNNEMNGDERQ